MVSLLTKAGYGKGRTRATGEKNMNSNLGTVSQKCPQEFHMENSNSFELRRLNLQIIDLGNIHTDEEMGVSGLLRWKI